MIIKLFSLSILGIGIFALVQVAMPFLAYQLWESKIINNDSLLIAPVFAGNNSSNIPGVRVETIGNFPAFISEQAVSGPLPYKDFNLSIPNLKLHDIKVLAMSNDFKIFAAHLPGTALPGEKGNVFISGHSSLPQLQNNKGGVFAKLPNVKKGDEVEIKAGGQKYIYVVEGMRVVKPEEVWVINPPDNVGRYLTLMTCVPPGFNTKRLIVLSKLKT